MHCNREPPCRMMSYSCIVFYGGCYYVRLIVLNVGCGKGMRGYGTYMRGCMIIDPRYTVICSDGLLMISTEHFLCVATKFGDRRKIPCAIE